MLRFAIGTVLDFTIAGIDTSGERKNIDNTKALKHIELLNDDQFDAIRFNSSFDFVSDDALYALLDTPEWKLPEE